MAAWCLCAEEPATHWSCRYTGSEVDGRATWGFREFVRELWAEAEAGVRGAVWLVGLSVSEDAEQDREERGPLDTGEHQSRGC